MKKRLLIIVFCLIVKFSFGQQFTDLTGDYLGQVTPRDTPVVFAPGIVSTEKHEHSSPTISKDGDEIYWSVTKSSNDSVYQQIFYTKFIGDRWTVPSLIPFSSGKYYEGGPMFSTDDNTLYIYRGKPAPPGGDADSINIIRYTRQGNEWIKPVIVGEGAFFSVAKNGNIYFKGKQGIYKTVYEKNKYQSPKLLNGDINKGRLNWTPFISSDESYLIFSSHRDGEYGNGDLYICFQKVNGDWTKSINLGETINTSRQERFPYVSQDGKYLFFTRSNPPNRDDVWWVSSQIIEKLKEKHMNEQ